jgi:hypothetical protein
MKNKKCVELYRRKFEKKGLRKNYNYKEAEQQIQEIERKIIGQILRGICTGRGGNYLPREAFPLSVLKQGYTDGLISPTSQEFSIPEYSMHQHDLFFFFRLN